MSDERTYPQRPYLAVSAAIIRGGKVLLVRRARKPALNLYTLPGGAVEAGEALTDAIVREVREETSLEIEPSGFAGHREVIVHDSKGRTERHFVILCFAARWLDPSELAAYSTTEGLAEIVAAAVALLSRAG